MVRLPKKLIDITGKTFRFLLVISYLEKSKWTCKCLLCGNLCSVYSHDLRSGHAKSCGCQKKYHGMKKTSEYQAWKAMKRRCYNFNCKAFPNYGGRGIKVYEPWFHDFQLFFKYIGPKPGSKYTLDRIDNNGNYEPGNIRWATYKEQARNTRRCNKREEIEESLFIWDWSGSWV